MPFDDRGFSETKPAPFSIEALAAWLETQCPEETYFYHDPRMCLWGAYTRSQGGVMAGGYYVIGKALLNTSLPERANVIVAGGDWPATRGDWTYGAALARARRILAGRQTNGE